MSCLDMSLPGQHHNGHDDHNDFVRVSEVSKDMTHA